MTPTLAISALAFLLLWRPGGAAAKTRRVGSRGGSSYCVNDYDQPVLCGETIASIVGGAISGIFLLAILYCIGLALWRRHRRRRALLRKLADAENRPETSTIASGSSFHNTAHPIAEPAPAYMRYPDPEQPNQPNQPNVVPVGTYAAPQGPPAV